MSPDEVLEKHDAYRLQQWRIFDALSPIGARRGDIQAATIVQELDTLLRARAPGARPLPLDDCLFQGDNQQWLRTHVRVDSAEDAAGQERLRLYRINAAKAKETVRQRKQAKAAAAKAEIAQRKAARRGKCG